MRMGNNLKCLVSVLCLLGAAASHAQKAPEHQKQPKTGQIQVPIAQLRHPGHGALVVVLFQKVGRVEMQMDQAYRVMKRPVNATSTTVTFEKVPYGEYAVGAFHDLNQDGELETNFIGFPQEDMAISRNAKGGPLGGPTWRASKVRLAQPVLVLEALRLHPFGPDSVQ